jgi:hypothetical protein
MSAGLKYTAHGLERARFRTMMNPQEILEILSSNRSILVGQERGSSRVHRLFYSLADDCTFVGVLDDVTQEVITILPPGQSFWTISMATHLLARSLVTGETFLSSSEPRPPVPVPTQRTYPPSDHSVQVRILAECTDYLGCTIHKLLRLRGSDFDGVDVVTVSHPQVIEKAREHRDALLSKGLQVKQIRGKIGRTPYEEISI